MATKKPVVTNPLNYLGIPAGQSPSTPAPKPKTSTPSAPVDATTGLVIGSPDYQRAIDKRDMALANYASGSSTPMASMETRGSLATDKAEANAAVASAEAFQRKARQVIQDDPEYKVLAQKFKDRGMDDFADLYLQASADYPNASPETLQDLLKTDKKYNFDAQGNAKGFAKRFAGNAALIKAGKVPLDEAEYLKAETEYEKTFKGYNLPLTMRNKESYAKLISNEISADEATTRIKLGYDNLQNNAKTLQAFQTFFPQLSQGDIVAAMLNPNEELPALQRKVTAAQIGGAALRQNLQTSQARAMELEGLGVTQATAEKGYGKIATYLTDAQKLAQIGKEEAFTQTTAEQSQIEGLASAQRKEAQLAEKEVNRFSSQVGAARGAFSKNTTF